MPLSLSSHSRPYCKKSTSILVCKGFRPIADTSRPTRQSLFPNLHIAMARQEAEISVQVELHRPEFQLRKPLHLSQRATAVAPIECGDRGRVPSAIRKAFTLIRRKVVKRQRSEPFANDDDTIDAAIALGLRRCVWWAQRSEQ